MLYSLLAFLLGMFLGVSAQTIHQWPVAEIKAVGSPLSLGCTIKGKSSPNLYWYWQATGGTLQQLFYSITVGQVESVVQLNLSASRPKDDQFILSTEKLLLSHSGFYLCAWDWGGAQDTQYFGPGTRLLVLGELGPHVRVLSGIGLQWARVPWPGFSWESQGCAALALTDWQPIEQPMRASWQLQRGVLGLLASLP